jgi:transcription elongation factor Elf1
MNDAIKIIRGDSCPKCNEDRCVEAYDIRNKPIGYTYLLDTRKTDKLVNLQLSYMRCSQCRTEFHIDWSNRENPRPLYEAFVDGFFARFKKN